MLLSVVSLNSSSTGYYASKRSMDSPTRLFVSFRIARYKFLVDKKGTVSRSRYDTGEVAESAIGISVLASALSVVHMRFTAFTLGMLLLMNTV